MKNLFHRSVLTNKEKAYVNSVQRSSGLRLVFTVIVFAMVFFLYSFHFESKIIQILSTTSMIDDTSTLGYSDRRSIKEIADKIKENHSLGLRFHIKHAKIELPRLPDDVIYIAINPIIKDILVSIPAPYLPLQARLDDHLNSCLINSYNQSEDTTLAYIYSAELLWDNKLAICFISGLENLSADLETFDVKQHL